MRHLFRCVMDAGRKKELGTQSSDLRLLSSALASTGVTRRRFLRSLLATPLAASLDVEKLLWIPNQTIAVPTITVPTISMADIVALEMERMQGKVARLFERDTLFYANITSAKPNSLVSIRGIRVPLTVRPGHEG